MSFNKLQKLWVIALILLSPSLSDQTMIKQADESKGKTIDTKTTNDRKRDVYIPHDDRDFLTYVDFNKTTKNESYLRVAYDSPTNKEKESYLNGSKSVTDTVIGTEDENNAFRTKEGAVVQHFQENVDKEEKFIVKGDYVKLQKASRDLKTDSFSNSQNPDTFLTEEEEFLSNDGKFISQEVGSKEKDDKNNNLKIEQRDITNALDYGMRALEELVKVKEPLLYKLGLFLDGSNPAAKVANFGAPSSPKAIVISRIGFATLEASKKIAEIYTKNAGRQSAGIPAEFQSRIDLDECPLRGRPRCSQASRRFRTSDGTCNNLKHPWRGSAMLPMQRFLAPVYEDGIQGVRRSVLGTPLTSPREISTVFHREKNQEIQSVTLMFTQWGQFIDHDVTSTVKSRSFNGSIPQCCEGGGRRVLPPELLHPSCLPIEVPPTDPFLSRFGIGCMEFIRSAPSTRIDCELGWREQINQVTPYIDASTIYGSDVDTSDSTRTFRNGQIFYGRPSGQEPLNPPDPPGGELCRAGALSEECIQTGDGRFSENPGLVAMHTIFVRYHNKVAGVLSQANPHWSDERIFQETRRIVYSVIQHITYREYLPIVLGPEVMDLFEIRLLRKGYYDKYDDRIYPTIANSFSTAAFRFGHSMVQNSFIRTDSHHIPLPNNVSLHNEISNFENIWSFGSVDRIILGLSNQPSQKRDEFMADELTNHLFQFSDATPFGMDLAAINIQRGRDHGIPPYTFWRKPCGLTPIKNWRDLEQVMSISSVIRLRSLYAHVDDIDLFTAGLAERPLRGAVVGPTFACIIAQQFSNLRKGDRFWYENEAFDSSFSPAQLQQIRRVSLAQILCQTMDEIETIQPFAFLSADNARNVRVNCDSPEIRNFDLGAWVEESFELNSLSGDTNEFEAERSLSDFVNLTRLGRKKKMNTHITKNSTDKGNGDTHNFPFNLNNAEDLFTPPKHKANISKAPVLSLESGEQLDNNSTYIENYQNISRLRRDASSARSKKTKTTTKRPRTSTTKTVTAIKKLFKIKSTTTTPHWTSTVGPINIKCGVFNDIPKKPTFSVPSSTIRPNSIKPNYYQIRDKNHDDVTYLLGLVPQRVTTPPASVPVQLNINIHYAPVPTISTTTSPPINKKKRPNSTTRPSVISNYGTSRPTLATSYRPTQGYNSNQNNVVVITKRPPSRLTTKEPEVVSYPIFIYSSAYERPNDYSETTKRPTYFFDNLEYATTNGHKRPNNNFETPRPTVDYYSISNSYHNGFTKLPQSYFRPTNGYYTNHNENDDSIDNQDQKPIYIQTSYYQNPQTLYRPTIFEDEPFSSSDRPTYSNSDVYSNKKPISSNYYFDNDRDVVVVSGNKKRPQTNSYHRDEYTTSDDIINEFFHRYIDPADSGDRVLSESTPRTSVTDKLDFKSRFVYKPFDNRDEKDGDGFIQISAVKKEVDFGREGDDIKEWLPKRKSRKRARHVKKIRVTDIDVSPSESSGQWVRFNATEEDAPYMEMPVLPVNIPCSYEVPKPMIFLPAAEDSNSTRAR